jgi:hypothetical protein
MYRNPVSPCQYWPAVLTGGKYLWLQTLMFVLSWILWCTPRRWANLLSILACEMRCWQQISVLSQS